jgi:hypothetical protein
MAESSENSAGDGVDKKPEGQPAESNLPVVWSPKLGAGMEDEAAALGADEGATASSDDATHTETLEAETSEPATAASPTRSWRFALLAAAIALVAATGSFVGALTASGIVRSTPEIAPTTNTADASAVLRVLKSQIAELAAMKSSLDGAVRNANTQYTAISDRLDRVERVASAPSAQLAHISDTVDRLNKVNASPETTGSIPTPATPSEAKITDRIVQDWMVQAVHGDRALVESREGGLFEVGAGSVLPGLGKVESVKRQDGQWVVVTARGVITSGR